jgi:hypothetical protein
MKRTGIIIAALLLFWLAGYSQKDTARMVRELTDLLAFTEKPFIGYELDIQVRSSPVLESIDTVQQHAVFIKRNNDLYFNNGRDEMVILDSVFFRISNERQSIWISKLSKEQKEEFRHIVPGEAEMTAMVKKGYTIENSPAAKPGYKQLKLHSKNYRGEGNAGSVTILYDPQKNWPEMIGIDMELKQPASDEMIAELKESGMDTKALIRNENNINYVIRKQSMECRFTNMKFKKEDLAAVPGWKDILIMNEGDTEWKGKGKYIGYEVIKLY